MIENNASKLSALILAFFIVSSPISAAMMAGNDGGVIGVVAAGNKGMTAGNDSTQVDVAAADLQGSGTTEDPYVITNASELQAMEDDLDAHYRLGEDINASNTSTWNSGKGFDPVGGVDDKLNTPGSSFSGTFDGDGHAITGLTIDRPNEDFVGLFGNTSSESAISGVTLTGADITGNENVGSLVGDHNGGTIENVSADGSVTGVVADDNGPPEYVGGIAGANTDGATIKDISASVTVTGTVFVGGVTGSNGGRITNASASGPTRGVDAGLTNAEFVGGLVGYNTQSATIQTASASGAVNGTDRIGGLAGRNIGTIRNVSATGSVDGFLYIGGLIGSNSGTVERAVASGDVVGTSVSGGLAGTNFGGGKIGNASASGAVTIANDGQNLTVDLAGGLVGENDGTIQDTFAVGRVSSQEPASNVTVGGLVAKNFTTTTSGKVFGTVRDSYWDTQATDQSASAGSAIDRTTSQMTGDAARSNMSGLTYGEVWEIRPSDYPALIDDPKGPTAVNDSYTTPEDTTLTVPAAGVLSNDTDPDSDSLTAVVVRDPTNGSLTLNDNGSFSYTPNAEFAGTDSFIYNASDGTISDAGTVTITVSEVNDAPTAANDSYTTSENSTLTVSTPGVLDNDSDPENDTLSASSVSGPTNGALTLNANGSFSYTPNAGFVGTDSFTYNASDGSLNSTATVTITVNEANKAPTAVGDAYSTPEDSTIRIPAPGVLENDSDPNGDSLTATLVSGPTDGSVTLNDNGSFSYTPNADFNGTDSFTYKASDGALNSTATVTINVTGVDDTAPVLRNATAKEANENSYTVKGGDQVAVSVNVTDPESAVITSVTVDASGFGAGTVSLFETNVEGVYSGTFTVNASKVQDGSRRPQITATDGAGNTNSTRTKFALTLDTVPPTANVTANRTTITPGETVRFNASGSSDDRTFGLFEHRWDFDSDGVIDTSRFFSISETVTHTFQSSGTYTVNLTVTDQAGNTDRTSTTIVVSETNGAPVAVDDTYRVSEDRQLSVDTAAGVLANDSDPDGDPLNVTLVSRPTNGSMTLNSNGSFTYTPNTDFSGTDSFTYNASDGARNSTATVTITVSAVNDAPVARNDTYSVNESTDTDLSELAVSAPGVLGNDSDPDGDSLSANVTSQPANGTLSLYQNGSLSYTPDQGYVGTDSFTYTASDGQANDTATVTITVEATGSDGSTGDGAVQTDVDPSDLPGNGTQSDPYEISNASELQAMEDDLDAHYELVSDINASNTSNWNDGMGFDPVGENPSNQTTATSFNGSLYGGHHKITGLTINRPTENLVGLIGVAAGTSQIQNLTVSGTVNGSDATGLIVGAANTTIEDVTASGTVNGSDFVGLVVGATNSTMTDVTASGTVYGSNNTGGLTGFSADGAVIRNVAASSNVTGSVRVGGLVGEHEGILRNARVSGDVAGSAQVGGLAGRSDATNSIRNATAASDVTGSDRLIGGLVGSAADNSTIETVTAAGEVNGADNTGGLVGFSGDDSVIRDATASGSVTGSVRVGGLVGEHEGLLRNARAIGNVTGSTQVGGLAGRSDATNSIRNATAAGDITGSDRLIGGLVGSAADSSTIQNVTAAGEVNGADNTGGLVGFNGADSVIRDADALGNVTGTRDVGGLVGTNTDGGTIRNATAVGTVDGTEVVGGFAGRNQNGSVIIDSNASGRVTGSNFVGGFVGFNSEARITTATASGSVSVPDPTRSVGGFVGLRSGGTIEDVTASALVNGIDPIAIRHGGGGASGTVSASGDKLDAEDLEVNVVTSGEFVKTSNVTFGGDSATALRIRNGTGRTVTIKPKPGEPNFVLTGDTEIDLDIYTGNGEIDEQPDITVINDTGDTFVDVNVTVSGNTSMFSSGVPNNTETTPSRPFDTYTIELVNASGDTVSSTGPRLIGIGYNSGSGIKQNSTTGKVKFTIPRERTNEGINESWFVRFSLNGDADELESVPVENRAGDDNFSVVVDVSDLSPGKYTSRFELYRQDPSGAGDLSDRVINVFGVNEVTIEAETATAPAIAAPSNATYDPTQPFTIGTGHNATGVINSSDVAIRLVNVTAGNNTVVAVNESVPVEGSANTTIPADTLSDDVTVETQLYNSSSNQVIATDTLTLTAASSDDSSDAAPVIFAPPNTTYDPKSSFTIGTSHNATGVIGTEDIAVRLVNVTDGNDTVVAVNDSVPIEGSVNTTIPAGTLSGNVTIQTQLYNTSSKQAVANDTVELSVAASAGGGTSGPAPIQVDVDPSDLEGDGSQSNPYVITNASELQAMEDDVDAYYELGSDINATATAMWNNGSGFAPIGRNQDFNGTFDGANHTVSGLTINRSGESGVGLFASISGGTVRNVTLAGVNVTGLNAVGGLVGSNGGTVRRVTVTGTVAGPNQAGGVAGSNLGGTVQTSVANVSVTGQDSYIGGLVGYNENGVVNNSYAVGTVSGGSQVGGLVGSNSRGTIRNSFAAGEVLGTGSGLAGGFGGTVTGSYWDVNSTGQTTTGGDATPLTTAQMTGQAAKTNMTALAFGTIWQTQTDDYPALRPLSDSTAGGEPTPTPTPTPPETATPTPTPPSETATPTPTETTQTETKTDTSTATETTTTEQTTTTTTTTDGDGGLFPDDPTTTASPTETTGQTGPGFTIMGTLLALLGAALLLRRSQR